jgi:Amt family ammonium transporter
MLSGLVGGLVGVTPAAGLVNPQGAMVIGLLAGVACWFGAVKLKRWLKVDDSLDAFGVHGMGGIVGALLTGVFADAAINGAAEGATILKQAIGLIAVIAWSAVGPACRPRAGDRRAGFRPARRDAPLRRRCSAGFGASMLRPRPA